MSKDHGTGDGTCFRQSTPLLDVRGLSTRFRTSDGTVHAVEDVSFSMAEGACLAIVGESGSGKTVTALSILGLIDPPGHIEAGQVLYRGRNLRGLSEDKYREVRGSQIAMIFQDPLSTLNPTMTVGAHVIETLRVHQRLPRRAARARAVQLLTDVGIPRARERLDDYPHQFSGGMRQRVGIAIALSCDPSLLIADEPTTALDVTIQAQVLELIGELIVARKMAVLLVTHDLGVVAEFCDEVVVMYAGRVVERADVTTIFGEKAAHPYTRSLLAAVSRLDRPRSASKSVTTIPGSPPDPVLTVTGCAFEPRCFLAGERERCHEERPRLRHATEISEHVVACHFAGEAEKVEPWGVTVDGRSDLPPEPVRTSALRVHPAFAMTTTDAAGDRRREILRLDGLTKHFPITSGLIFRRTTGTVRAVEDVSFVVYERETLGLVGESGCGKSTLIKTVLRLLTPTAGRVLFRGEDIAMARSGALRALRRDIQMVFQDAYASLNPRLRVGSIVAEPLRVHHITDPRSRVSELLEHVELRAETARRYPHELSGGQRQRVAIARAIATRPKLLLCDEPVSALDVSVRGQILNLLADLQDRFGLSYILVSHDLSVIRDVADRVGVMYLGNLVEMAATVDLFERPRHPYTKALISAVPVPHSGEALRRHRIVLRGDIASASSPPSGCRFHTRCWKAEDVCATDKPLLEEMSPGHWAACHFAEDGAADASPQRLPSTRRLDSTRDCRD